MNKKYNIVRNNPVARFFYKGASHTHPVRRTVILIDNNRDYLTGFELREGRVARDLNDAPVKTYSKDKIAKIANIDSRRVLRANANKKELNNSTLVRESISSLTENGI